MKLRKSVFLYAGIALLCLVIKAWALAAIFIALTVCYVILSLKYGVKEKPKRKKKGKKLTPRQAYLERWTDKFNAMRGGYDPDDEDDPDFDDQEYEE